MKFHAFAAKKRIVNLHILTKQSAADMAADGCIQKRKFSEVSSASPNNNGIKFHLSHFLTAKIIKF